MEKPNSKNQYSLVLTILYHTGKDESSGMINRHAKDRIPDIEDKQSIHNLYITAYRYIAITPSKRLVMSMLKTLYTTLIAYGAISFYLEQTSFLTLHIPQSVPYQLVADDLHSVLHNIR